MKKTVVVLMALITAFSAFAERVELTRDTKFLTDNEGYIGEYGWFLNGTRMEISDRSTYLYARGREIEVYRVRRFTQRSLDRMYGRRLENALDVNDGYVDVYISRRDLHNNAVRVRDNRPVGPVRPVRPVRDNSYEVCYEQPRKKVVSIDTNRRNEGIGQAIFGGLLAGVASQFDNDLAQVIGVGAGLVIAGQGINNISQARDVVFVSDYNCRQYYDESRVVNNFRTRDGDYCTVTRYSSSEWRRNGRTRYSYHETSCRSGRYSFNF